MEARLSQKVGEIVTCARSLLATGGYNGFSYADIAEAVHISKASIHHYFPSKAVLVRKVVVDRYRAEARAGMDAIERQISDPLAQLHAYTGYWAACIRDGTAPFCICAMLAAEMPAIPEEVAILVQGHFRDLGAWLTSVLTNGAAEGLFQLRTTAESEAMAFAATVHGAMLSARAYGDAGIFTAIVRPVMRRLSVPN